MSKINKICILGGGTAGFSTACLLARYKELSKIDLDITVVYSSNIGNIGVGESTLLSVNDIFKYLNLSDEDWMKDANATYKTSISFENFYKKGNQFQYPFGEVLRNPQDPQYIDKWWGLRHHSPEEIKPEMYAKYLLPHARMNEQNKLGEDAEAFPWFSLDKQSAYHFDTHLLAKVFKKYAEKRGVKFIDDLYTNSVLNNSGEIDYIVCENQNVSADLFVDCSGFKSLLLEKVMGSEFVDYNETLINNRVVRTKIDYTDKQSQLKNYTNCFALDNGWCWEIPLWDKMSLGYVHSLKFTSEEDIVEEFKSHAKNRFGVDIKDDDIDIINYRTGHHEKGWIKNVVGVGLSYGFLEPLESTGILTLLHNAFRLLELLSKRKCFCTQIDRDAFNYSTKRELTTLRAFVESHYYLSSRDDSEYWKHVTENVEYSGDAYDDVVRRSIQTRTYDNVDRNNGLPFILGAMDYSPYSSGYMLCEEESEEMSARKKFFLESDEYFNKAVDKMPSTYQYLKNNIYK